MFNLILNSYQRFRAGSPDAGGKAPDLVEHDYEVAKLAAAHSEADLRQATVMRAAFQREPSKAPLI